VSNSLAVLNAGLVTSVGLSMPASAAAIRAGVTNPTETGFKDSTGAWIMAHCVALEHPWRGLTKLAKMAAHAIEECMADVPRYAWSTVPLLLCVAERERPGRPGGLDAQLFGRIQRELGVDFAAESLIVPLGRTSVATALQHARRMIAAGTPLVLIAAADCLITWPTLRAYERANRLLTDSNSNGFMPGEGAGALLVAPAAEGGSLVCTGIGLGVEPAHINSEEPLRGNGLTAAIKSALQDAGCELQQLDFRVADLSGEQYYFKEAALAFGRVLRKRKAEFDLWHPAEFTGETGAVSGVTNLAVAMMAGRKQYAPGGGVLLHASADDGTRAAIVAVTGLAHG
jgi:3-oxoacyl-[acyl-carrier-protein] synthase-1